MPWTLAQSLQEHGGLVPPVASALGIHYEATALRLLAIFYSIFWVWMLLHCLKIEPDRFLWIWIILVLQGVGPLLYFLLRYLPSTGLRLPSSLSRWTRGQDVARLTAAAVQIGNAHQFVQLGDMLRETGSYDKAAEAYDRALTKDAENLPALWGAAQVAYHNKRPIMIRNFTRRILDLDPQYKFGDVSLAYGRYLVDLGERDPAVEHLVHHIQRWRHPEALYLLAKLCVDRGDSSTARQHLESLLLDVSCSPTAIARRHGRWKIRAQQLLRKLTQTSRA